MPDYTIVFDGNTYKMINDTQAVWPGDLLVSCKDNTNIMVFDERSNPELFSLRASYARDDHGYYVYRRNYEEEKAEASMDGVTNTEIRHRGRQYVLRQYGDISQDGDIVVLQRNTHKRMVIHGKLVGKQVSKYGKIASDYDYWYVYGPKERAKEPSVLETIVHDGMQYVLRKPGEVCCQGDVTVNVVNNHRFVINGMLIGESIRCDGLVAFGYGLRVYRPLTTQETSTLDGQSRTQEDRKYTSLDGDSVRTKDVVPMGTLGNSIESIKLSIGFGSVEKNGMDENKLYFTQKKEEKEMGMTTSITASMTEYMIGIVAPMATKETVSIYKDEKDNKILVQIHEPHDKHEVFRGVKFSVEDDIKIENKYDVSTATCKVQNGTVVITVKTRASIKPVDVE